jgi:hypothetical protein
MEVVGLGPVVFGGNSSIIWLKRFLPKFTSAIEVCDLTGTHVRNSRNYLTRKKEWLLIPNNQITKEVIIN